MCTESCDMSTLNIAAWRAVWCINPLAGMHTVAQNGALTEQAQRRGCDAKTNAKSRWHVCFGLLVSFGLSMRHATYAPS